MLNSPGFGSRWALSLSGHTIGTQSKHINSFVYANCLYVRVRVRAGDNEFLWIKASALERERDFNFAFLLCFFLSFLVLTLTRISCFPFGYYKQIHPKCVGDHSRDGKSERKRETIAIHVIWLKARRWKAC